MDRCHAVVWSVIDTAVDFSLINQLSVNSGTNVAINQLVRMSTLGYTSRPLKYLTDGITIETQSVYCTKVSRMEEHTFSLAVNQSNIVHTVWIHVNGAYV
jgi:hypothetical protein